MHTCMKTRVPDWLLSQMLLHTQGLSCKRDEGAPPCQGSSFVSLKPEEPRCPAAKAHGHGPGRWDNGEVARHSLSIPTSASLRTAARMLNT